MKHEVSQLLPWRIYRRMLYEKEMASNPTHSYSLDQHIEATLQWIFKAQTTTGTGGVSDGYHIALKRWGPPYAETTGYLIPTLYKALEHAAPMQVQVPIRNSIQRMSQWLISEQLESGAFPSGTSEARPRVPSVFNTGQILQGFEYLIRNGIPVQSAAARAAEWMISQQEESGAWSKGVSPLVEKGPHAYYIRAAWALGSYGLRVKNSAAQEAAFKNATYLMSQIESDGWFPSMGFFCNDAPLLHTIAYTLEGLLELSIVFDRPEWRRAVQSAAAKIQSVQKPSGSLPGKLKPGYTPAVSWTTSTGNAQMAVIWYRLFQSDSNPLWLTAANRAVAFNCRLQEMQSKDDNRRGGICGCYPYGAGYAKYWHTNWTAKFHLDSLLLKKALQ
jgi:hypothetical protein